MRQTHLAAQRTNRAPGHGEHAHPPPSRPTHSRQEERWSPESIASTSAPVTGWIGPVSEAGIKGRCTSRPRCGGALLVSTWASTKRRITSAGVAPSRSASVSSFRRTASGSSIVGCILLLSHVRREKEAATLAFTQSVAWARGEGASVGRNGVRETHTFPRSRR